MSDENPYRAESVEDADASNDEVSSGAAAYNVVSDVVTGVNVRKRDNLFQLAFILVSAILFAVVGIVLTAMNTESDIPWFAGALAGAFGGVVIGLFASGIFLMFYRAIRHVKGKHD